jgi:diguanylate cyclase (GGDEF)-like protein/PAS domain S-box-containing protein
MLDSLRRETPEDEGQRLALVLESSQLGMWDWDMTTGDVLIDNRAREIIGYSPRDLSDFTFDQFIGLCHPGDRDAVREAIEAHETAGSGHYQVEMRMKHKTAGWHWTKATGKIVERSSEGKPLRMVGVLEDIAALVEQRIALEIAQQQLEAAQRLARVGSWYLDIDTDQVTWSDELFRMQGLEPGSVPPPANTHHQLFSPESWEQLSSALSLTITEGTPYELELEMVNNGVFRGWMLARGVAIHGPQDNIVGVLGVALDITDRKGRENMLRQKAMQDPLTGLGNRAHFEVTIAEAKRSATNAGETFALMFLDLDFFKIVNDTFGHDVGDQALIAMAQRLEETVRGTDHIFRLGGDEFAVVITDVVSTEKLVEIGHRVIDAFRRPLLQRAEPLTATVSAGFVVWDGTETTSELLRRADAALYKAKDSGRDQVQFEGL